MRRRRAGGARAAWRTACTLGAAAARQRRRRRRHRVERHQHRHRAPALDRPHAAFPGHGLSAGAGLRVGRAASSPPDRARAQRSASASSCPARAASATCAACSAAPPRAWSCRHARSCRCDDALGERGGAAGAGRHRLPRARPRRTPAARPDHRARRARSAAGPHRRRARRRRRPSSGSAMPVAPRGAERLRRGRSRPTTRAATTAPSTTSAATPRCSTR